MKEEGGKKKWMRRKEEGNINIDDNGADNTDDLKEYCSFSKKM